MIKAPSAAKILSASAVMVGLLAVGTLCVAGQRGRGSMGRHFSSAQTNVVSGYSQPYYGGYSGSYSPYFGTYSSYSPNYSYAPAYWWSGPYTSTDPRGPGDNPNAGYAWDSVSVLVLETFPPKARVTLDGIFVGTTDCLGPFQLPGGEHTLRIEAAEYEPSETVLHIEKPVLQQLQVNLTPVSHGNKPAPK